MTAAIRVEDGPIPARSWDDYIRVHPEATLFHERRWLEAVAASLRYEPRCCVATREGRVCGVLPLYIVPLLPLGRALISSPLAVYGGPRADDPDVEAALLAHARAMGERLRARFVEYRNVMPLPDLPSRNLYVTFRREILPDHDANFARIPRNQRRSIRVACRHGLEAEVGGVEWLDPFYDVFSQSVRHLGTPVYPKALFRRLLESMGDSCRILVVRREGRVLSGVLSFLYRGDVLPYYGGSIREGVRYAVNDFMYWSLLRYGAERGYRRFDFGRSKRGTGSFDFKRHWGFEPEPLAYQYVLLGQAELPDLSPKNPRFSLAIRAWRRLPLWVTRAVGPRLVRYFP